MSLLRRLALLLALEGAALVVAGCVYAAVSADSEGDRAAAQLVAGAGVLTGVLLLVLARAVDRGKGWARSPAVVLNIFPFPLALDAAQGGNWWVAVPLALLPGGVLYLFGTQELRETFRERG